MGEADLLTRPFKLLSTITCPVCGTAKVETVPTDACQFFYDCTGCGTVLRPKPGDCCVFCSYGDVACPPMQAHGKSLGCGNHPSDKPCDRPGPAVNHR